jgi:PAS domain S-box-containing protein
MRQLSLAVSQSPVAVIITDAAGAIEYVNPSFEQTTGWTLEEVVGKNPSLLSSGTTANATYEQLWACISGGEIWRGVFENRRKDGTHYFASGTIAPLRDETGVIINYIGFQEDVTELREAESRQQQLEDQYRQAQKMEAIGTLAGGIAHDFNNILAAILGYVELAQTDVETGSSVYSDLQRIHEAGLRARDLVQQILTFSRMTEQSRLPIRVDLIFKETMKLLRSTLPTSVEVRIDFEHTEDTVLADSTQMHQLMLNLVTNAYQAIEESGKVTVRFRKINTDDELLSRHAGLVAGSYVRLEVIDTGVGIAPENLERIFDPFFTTKEQGKGTGLGLATTHGIVKSHGGVIDVVSEPREGTTFTVFLPCVEEPPERTDEPPAELPGGREHVLAVDDEGALARLLARRLRGLGYEVTVLEDSLEALEVFRANPSLFNLLLTDQQMPKMTGVQLAEACWRVRSDVPAVIMTGYSETLSPERALELGFSSLLAKPVSLMALAEAVREAIDAHRRKRRNLS